MVYIFHVIIGLLISPILWVFLFIIIAFFTKKNKKTFLFIGLFILYFFTSPLVFNVLSKFVEIKQSKISETSNYEYGILLGGIASLDASGDVIQFSANVTRLISALDLYRAGKISKILISAGGHNTSEIERVEAYFLKKYMIRNGIPENDILIEYKSINTHQNALFSAKILKPKINKSSYLLITSSYHLKRAKLCFEHEGFNIDGFASDRLGDIPKLKILQIIPSGGMFYKWHYILHEIIGQIAYKLMGYI